MEGLRIKLARTELEVAQQLSQEALSPVSSVRLVKDVPLKTIALNAVRAVRLEVESRRR